MLEYDKESLVYRIITGELYIPEYEYKLVAADARTKYKASCLYNSILEENKYSDWLIDGDCFNILVANKICDINYDINIKGLSESIEDAKIELYDSYFDSKKNIAVKKRLSLIKAKQIETINARHSLDHLTLSGFAEMIKQQYLIYANLVNKNGILVWAKMEDVDINDLDEIMGIVKANIPSHTQLRDIARTEPWRSYWNMSKNPFDCPVPNLTEEQRTLAAFTRMYDSIYEHPKCPPEAILNDDDALDGWMIKERRNREKEKENDLVEEKFKLKDADEVFLPAQSLQDIEKINNLNDIQSKMIKQQRESVINSKGKAVDIDFQDRRLAIQQQSNEKFIETVKGK